MNSKDRVKQILNDCCAGNATLATDILHQEFIIIHRDELPATYESTNGNGTCTSSAQEFYQPELYLRPANGDVRGEWNRKIAYANLAVAEAVEAKQAAFEFPEGTGAVIMADQDFTANVELVRNGQQWFDANGNGWTIHDLRNYFNNFRIVREGIEAQP